MKKHYLVGTIWLCILVAVATGSYLIKNQVAFMEAKLNQINATIGTDKKEIHVLKAELSHLKDPERIDKLAEKHLSVQPIKAERYISINSLPFKGKGDNQ